VPAHQVVAPSDASSGAGHRPPALTHSLSASTSRITAMYKTAPKGVGTQPRANRVTSSCPPPGIFQPCSATSREAVLLTPWSRRSRPASPNVGQVADLRQRGARPRYTSPSASISTAACLLKGTGAAGYRDAARLNSRDLMPSAAAKNLAIGGGDWRNRAARALLTLIPARIAQVPDNTPRAFS